MNFNQQVMDSISLIICCLVVQLATYLYLDRRKLSRWRYLLLTALLVLNCFFFSKILLPGDKS